MPAIASAPSAACGALLGSITNGSNTIDAASAIAICALTESTGGPSSLRSVDDGQRDRRRRRRHQARRTALRGRCRRPTPARPRAPRRRHRRARRAAPPWEGSQRSDVSRTGTWVPTTNITSANPMLGQQREGGIGGVDDVETGSADDDSGDEFTDDHWNRAAEAPRSATAQPCRRRRATPACRSRTRTCQRFTTATTLGGSGIGVFSSVRWLAYTRWYPVGDLLQIALDTQDVLRLPERRLRALQCHHHLSPHRIRDGAQVVGRGVEVVRLGHVGPRDSHPVTIDRMAV